MGNGSEASGLATGGAVLGHMEKLVAGGPAADEEAAVRLLGQRHRADVAFALADARDERLSLERRQHGLELGGMRGLDGRGNALLRLGEQGVGRGSRSPAAAAGRSWAASWRRPGWCPDSIRSRRRARAGSAAAARGCRRYRSPAPGTDSDAPTGRCKSCRRRHRSDRAARSDSRRRPWRHRASPT